MSDEWGPWIEHDGKGCPCVGMYVHVEYKNIIRKIQDGSNFLFKENFAWFYARGSKSWYWERGFNPILRYRIRKPRGMKILQQLVENPPKELIEDHA